MDIPARVYAWVLGVGAGMLAIIAAPPSGTARTLALIVGWVFLVGGAVGLVAEGVGWARPRVSRWLTWLVGNITIRAEPPGWWPGRKRKLRQETFDLVREIRAYVKTKPNPVSQSLADYNALRSAKDEAESNAIWEAQTDRIIERSAEDRRELAERFGGRVRYLLGEYVRRGKLAPSETVHLENEFTSVHWLTNGASTLEALARSL